MTFDDKKNSYGSTDLEAGVTGSRIKDAADGPRRFAVIAWVHEQKHPGTYCKQKQNNVLVSTACPCACAGY